MLMKYFGYASLAGGGKNVCMPMSNMTERRGKKVTPIEAKDSDPISQAQARLGLV